MEEVYWQQRSGRNLIIKGDANSRFFHLFANDRRTKNNISHHDFRVVDENLISVAFNPKTATLDQIYLKAAGSVIQHILAENGGNLRSAARDLGANHSTLSRILTKFNSRCEVKNFQPVKSKFAVAA